jgi:hypothetical protein
LFEASKIGENTFDLLRWTLVFLSANGVVNLFTNVVGVVVNEDFGTIIFG